MNQGILYTDPKPEDYILGGQTSITTDRKVDNWSSFLPAFETQRDAVADMMDCTTFSAIHCIESQVNYLLSVNAFPQDAVDYFTTNGYMQNGKFRVSVRFNAKMNGTTKKGNYMNTVAEGIRTVGMVPDSDWSFVDGMTWDEYYAEIPQNLKDKALGILKYVDIKYQWAKARDIVTALAISPIQIASGTCPGWETGNTVQACGAAMSHCTMIYDLDSAFNYCIMDHYNPFLKKLSPDYPILASMQYIVNPIKTDTTAQQITLIKQEISIIQRLINLLKGWG